MATESTSAADALTTLLDELAAFEPGTGPFVSLYLDLRPDRHGRETHTAFLRRTLPPRVESPGRDASADAAQPDDRLTALLARVDGHVASLPPSAAGTAVFARLDDDYFAALPLDGLDGHQLFIGRVPHLYPLVRAVDHAPRYAAAFVDNHKATLLVFGLGAATARTEVRGEKTRRHSMGGWSQARYQRRTDNLHLHHLRDVADALALVVRDEGIDRIVIAGTTEVVARFRDQLPGTLQEKVVDELRLDRHAAEADFVAEALAAFRAADAADDAASVAAVVDAWRGRGLGAVGPDATLRALELGQVDELLITAIPEMLEPVQQLPGDAAPPPVVVDPLGDREAGPWRLADELVTRAVQTGARVRLIEDRDLLGAYGGVAAALRFRV